MSLILVLGTLGSGCFFPAHSPASDTHSLTSTPPCACVHVIHCLLPCIFAPNLQSNRPETSVLAQYVMRLVMDIDDARKKVWGPDLRGV